MRSLQRGLESPRFDGHLIVKSRRSPDESQPQSQAAIPFAVAPSKRAAANVTLLAQIKAAHAKSDASYGMQRIRAELADQGVVANRKRTASVMRLAGRP